MGWQTSYLNMASPIGAAINQQLSPLMGSVDFTPYGGGGRNGGGGGGVAYQTSGEPSWINDLNDAFAQMAALNSANAQASYAPQAQLQGTIDTNRSMERISGQRVGATQQMMPAILAALTSLMGTGNMGGGGQTPRVGPTAAPPRRVDEYMPGAQPPRYGA